MAGGVRVKVTGESQVIASLRAFGRQASNLDSIEDISNRMKRLAITLAPVQTGALARSIEARPMKNRARIVAGGPSRRSHGGGVYAKIAEYGKYTHRSKGPRPFMRTAVEKTEGYARRKIENELETIARRLDLTGR